MELHALTALQLGEKIRAGEVSPVEAAQAALDRVRQEQGRNNAFITVLGDAALSEALETEKQLRAGARLSPLAGVPMGLKDNICTKGIKTSCASKILGDFAPPYDATLVQRLRAAGGVLLGKLNMDEFAMGSTSETSFYGPVRNPWGLTRVPGGSSGGAAAAVAAGECWYAVGSDTGGSIRQPAAYCGVTGMLAGLTGDVRGMKIGLPADCFGEGLEPEVRACVLAAADVLRARGAQVEEFALPIMRYVVPAYYMIAAAEASSNLSRFDGVKYGWRAEGYEDLTDLYSKTRTEGFGAEVKRRILLGAFVLSAGYYDAYYKKALQVKAVIKRAYDEAFEKYDLLLTPVAPSTAPRLGESLDDPLKMYLSDIYTVPLNLAGLPGLSMPCGFDGGGMPIGAQLIGPALGEAKVLGAAHAFQLDTDYHTKMPKGGDAQ